MLKTQIESSANIPDHLLHPGGVLEDIMNYIDQKSAASIPWFNLGAALTFLGSVMGQKVMTETQLRTNLYTITLGSSGLGKNAPFSPLLQLLEYSGGGKLFGPTDLTSSDFTFFFPSSAISLP